MKVTSQQVKALQKRIDITYEEAEKFIRRAKGDIDQAEAIVRAHQKSFGYRAVHESERLFNELLTYHVRIETDGRVLLHLPLILLFGMFMVLTVDSKIWMTVISIGLILITESDVSIDRIERDGGFIRHWRRNDESKNESHSEPSDQGTVPEDMPTNEKREAPEPAGKTGPEVQPNEAVEITEAAAEPVPTEEVVAASYDEDDDDYYEITIDK